MNLIKRELVDYRILLRNIPGLVLCLFVVSVIMMNLLANKEFISFKYLALDCGFPLIWVSFQSLSTEAVKISFPIKKRSP